jgi:NADPH-dependent 2,4-dienoyl-CoA reductase/sulfur reductase-like enzyme
VLLRNRLGDREPKTAAFDTLRAATAIEPVERPRPLVRREPVASAPGGRAEHWTAAAASARAVAHAIVGLPAPQQSPAYFWSDQFGNRLQVVGRSAGAGRPELQEGDGWFIARYRPTGRSVEAIALLNRPDLLAAARREVSCEEVVAA